MNETYIDLYSESYRVLGIDWKINVEISTDKTNDKSKNVGIFLYADGNYTKE